MTVHLSACGIDGSMAGNPGMDVAAQIAALRAAKVT